MGGTKIGRSMAQFVCTILSDWEGQEKALYAISLEMNNIITVK